MPSEEKKVAMLETALTGLSNRRLLYKEQVRLLKFVLPRVRTLSPEQSKGLIGLAKQKPKVFAEIMEQELRHVSRLLGPDLESFAGQVNLGQFASGAKSNLKHFAEEIGPYFPQFVSGAGDSLPRFVNGAGGNFSAFLSKVPVKLRPKFKIPKGQKSHTRIRLTPPELDRVVRQEAEAIE